MSSRDQTTPPFNSPYQQALKSTPLLHSPAYPSPARSDSEPSKFHTDGLGLYNYSQAFPTSGPQNNSILFPPSPQPTEAWTQLSNGASPLISEPIVDPWTSGAYDHPVTRSPIPWPHYQASHRSSLSSQRDMSVFSGEGSEHAFPDVKLEAGPEWTTDDDQPAPNTVTPDRLTNASIFPYDHTYGSPSMPRFDATPGPGYESHHVEHMTHQGRSGTAQSEGRLGPTPRVRRRRNKTAPEDAKFSCDICGRGFVRSYNKKSHMERHDPNRAKINKCHAHGCDMRFERKTDLDRHYKSVHLKLKDERCGKCNHAFSRKDTLRRHEEDGCTKRNQLPNPSLLSRTRPMQTAPDTQQGYYHSPRSDMYTHGAASSSFGSGEHAHGLFDAKAHHHSEGEGFGSRSPLFRDNGYGTSPHGY